MQFLVFKEYVILFLLLLVTGCASAPNTKTIAEVYNAGNDQKSIDENIPSEERLLAESKEVDRLEAKVGELLPKIISKERLVAAGDKKSLDKNKLSKEELLAASKEIDRLEAEIAEQQTRFRAFPRRHFVGSRSKDADVALYMETWRKKVEKFGNKSYPEEARNKHIYGKVQLTTSIKSDGSIEKAELDKSSGYEVLDDHALSIVRNAAPYLPFSKTMKDKFDILSITRTFTYTQENDSQVISSPLN